MTETERVKEWVAWYRASSQKYSMNALLAVLETDGEKMLGMVLRELGLVMSLELIKDAQRRDR